MNTSQLNSFIDYLKNLQCHMCGIDSTKIRIVKDRPFEAFVKNINDLIIFINENKDIFISYFNKVDTKTQLFPFDIICGIIIQKIEDVSKYKLDSYFRPMDLADDSHFIDRFNILLESNSSIYNNLYVNLNNFLNSKLIVAFKILKKLSDYHKTLIILGPNGSGKTSFANFLRNADNHIKVIPADKPIRAVGHIPTHYSSTLDTYSDEVFSKDCFGRELLQKLIIAICSEHDDISRDDRRTGNKTRSKFEMIKDIFESFFDIELLDNNFSKKHIMAKKKGVAEPYEFNNMSEGERVAFFYIATTIVAPSQSFILVDEPENHLNPAIYNKIWDRLIKERQDCQFIFISHTMEFINARQDFELIKIKNFVFPDKFEFESFGDSLENIDPNFLVEIVGSRKPILFCEGNKTSFDYKVYEILFGNDYTIIPAGTCNSVINHVKALHPYIEKLNNLKAVGIIDSDLKNHQDKEMLLKDSIYTLDCNEIEMLLVDEIIFKAVAEHLFQETNIFDNFKQVFFEKLKERKDHILARIIKHKIDNILHNSFIDDKKNRSKEELKSNINSIVNEIDIDHLWKEYDEELSNIISDNDFDKALRYCCLGHNEIIGGLCNRLLPDYANQALGILSVRPDLQKIIKKKYIGVDI